MRQLWGFVLTFLYALGAIAQEADQAAEIDELEPSVDTSAAFDDLEPAVDTSQSLDQPRTPDVERVDLSAEREARMSEPVPKAGGAKTNQQFQAMDELDLGTTSITGNQELPKVLYIVPWKRSDLGDLVGRPVNTLLDEVLSPVDPEVFRRHLDYYDGLYGESQEE